jgi:hypothetical protein
MQEGERGSLKVAGVCLPTMSLSPPLGQLGQCHLQLWGLGEGQPSSPSGGGRVLGRQPGQGACLMVSLDIGNVEVCGCEVMVVGSVGLGVPSQPSSCWVHLFGPQLSKHVESSLSPIINPIPPPSPSHASFVQQQIPKYPASWHSPLPISLSYFFNYFLLMVQFLQTAFHSFLQGRGEESRGSCSLFV